MSPLMRTTATPGLTSEEAERRRAVEGPNVLPQPGRPSPWGKLAAQFTHLLALLLWGAAGLAVLGGMPALAVAIVVVVVLNAAFAFWQEYRADRSAERLQSLLPMMLSCLSSGGRGAGCSAFYGVPVLGAVKVVPPVGGLHLDRACAPAEVAAMEQPARCGQRGRAVVGLLVPR